MTWLRGVGGEGDGDAGPVVGREDLGSVGAAVAVVVVVAVLEDVPAGGLGEQAAFNCDLKLCMKYVFLSLFEILVKFLMQLKWVTLTG